MSGLSEARARELIRKELESYRRADFAAPTLSLGTGQGGAELGVTFRTGTDTTANPRLAVIGSDSGTVDFSGRPYLGVYQGGTAGGAAGLATFRKGADLASAATLDLSEDGSSYWHVTGTTGITAIGYRYAGAVVVLEFDAALTITHAGSLALAGGVDYTTAAGDVLVFVSEGLAGWSEVAVARDALAFGWTNDGSFSNRDVGAAYVDHVKWALVGKDRLLFTPRGGQMVIRCSTSGPAATTWSVRVYDATAGLAIAEVTGIAVGGTDVLANTTTVANWPADATKDISIQVKHSTGGTPNSMTITSLALMVR